MMGGGSRDWFEIDARNCWGWCCTDTQYTSGGRAAGEESPRWKCKAWYGDGSWYHSCQRLWYHCRRECVVGEYQHSHPKGVSCLCIPNGTSSLQLPAWGGRRHTLMAWTHVSIASWVSSAKQIVYASITLDSKSWDTKKFPKNNRENAKQPADDKHIPLNYYMKCSTAGSVYLQRTIWKY